MDIAKFDSLVNQFLAYVNYLGATAKDDLPQARAALTGQSPSPDSSSPESDAELILRSISQRIEDVMVLHDSIQESIGMPPRYTTFFKSLELSAQGRRYLRGVLAEYSDPETEGSAT